MYLPLPEQMEVLAREIVDISFKVHKELGPGLLESVYEKCFCYELEQRGIAYQSQKQVPIIYNDLVIDEGLRLDILVEGQILIELKAQEQVHTVWEAQLLSYMKLTGKRMGFLINFYAADQKRHPATHTLNFLGCFMVQKIAKAVSLWTYSISMQLNT
jgi:GxxExxY protein